MRATLSLLQQKYQQGEKLAMLTCYDASFANLLQQQAVDILLVGDSLGMVLQGMENTLAVTLEQMVYHTRAVAVGAANTFVLADMPFASFQLTPQQTFANAAQLMAAGANMVKLEGGHIMLENVAFLVQRGIPVCAHLGLTPQSVNQLGGYKVQAREQQAAEQLLNDAQALQQAGAAMLVLEAIPADLAARVTAELSIPTIGIGAGSACSGQVLVLHDMLDIYPGKKARFVKNYMLGAGSVGQAVAAYVAEVKSGVFPAEEHAF